MRGYWKIGGTNYYGAYSAEASSTTPPAEVTGLQTTKRSASSLTLAWDAAQGAAGYTVYAYQADDGTYEKIAEVTSGATTYEVTNLEPAAAYRFKVEAFEKTASGNVAGAASKVYEDVTLPQQVSGAEAEGENAAVSLSWEEAEGVNGYQIYRLNTKPVNMHSVQRSKKLRQRNIKIPNLLHLQRLLIRFVHTKLSRGKTIMAHSVNR